MQQTMMRANSERFLIMHPEISRAIELVREKNWSIEQLYMFWWSGISTDGKRIEISQNLHDPILSKRVLIDGHSFVFSIATKVVSVEAGEFVDLDEKKSLIIRKSTWSSEWWNWMQTSHLRIYPPQKIMRFYIPSPLGDLSAMAAQIIDSLELAYLPAILKFRRQHGIFSDAIVVWVDEDTLQKSLELIGKLASLSQFSTKPPPLTKVFNGIGISDHPQTGESLGWLFCKLIWTASKANSLFDLEIRFNELELNIEKPWLIGRKLHHNNWESLL